MLEQMRRNSKGLIIWVLFGIIIAVFIISFGPQSGQQSQGCGTSAQHAMEVDGAEVSLHSWRFAMNGLGFGSGGAGPQAAERRTMALDFLLERELLAREAEARGFRVSDDVVNKSIAAGEMFVMGHRLDGARIYFRDGAFDYDMLERYASSVGLPSVGALVAEQRREQLAELMRGTLLASSRVSADEARQSFVQDNTKVTLDYVLFPSDRYAKALVLSSAELDSYAGRHEAELKKKWETEKAALATAKPRVQVRHIFVAREPVGKPAPAAEGAAPATEGAAASGAATPSPAAPDPALARLEAARARIARGADFASVAHEVSQDEETRALGGRLGWRPAESLGFGKEVVDATAALAVGDLSPVTATADGYHLIKLEARSDKALTFDDVRLDLAAELAPAYLGRSLARRDAEAALARARTTPLGELFKRAGTSGQGLPPGATPESLGLPGDPSAPSGSPAPSPGAGTDGGKQGWVVREGAPRYAQSGAAPAAVEPTTAAPTATAPSDEPLPKVTVAPPTLSSVGPVARQGDFLAGLGRSELLVADAFERLEVGKLADRVYDLETPEGFAVVVLTARSEPDLAKFDTERSEIEAGLAQQKSVEVLLGWLEGRCQEVSGAVKADRSVLSVDGDQVAPYQPCRNVNVMSVLQQLQTRQRR